MKTINSSGICPLCNLTVGETEVRMPLVEVPNLPAHLIGAMLHYKCAVTSRHAEAIESAFCFAGFIPNVGWWKSFANLGFASLSRYELQIFSPQLLLVLCVPRSQLKAAKDALVHREKRIDVRGLLLDFSELGTVDVRSCPHNWRVSESPVERIHRVFRPEIGLARIDQFVKLLDEAVKASLLNSDKP